MIEEAVQGKMIKELGYGGIIKRPVAGGQWWAIGGGIDERTRRRHAGLRRGKWRGS